MNLSQKKRQRMLEFLAQPRGEHKKGECPLIVCFMTKKKRTGE